jgi:regulator of sirC expression with transglutaminase-like and TPR domain
VINDTLRARKTFADIAAHDESVFPLDRAALAIALEEYPEIQMEHYLRRLDTLAARCEVLTGQNPTSANILEALNETLFVQEGLAGNTEDYYDPANSYLNRVLDTKRGIPISLSVIYIEVARRLGLTIAGVGFPGHFLVKHVEHGQEMIIDPFNQGRVLTLSQCQELLDRVYGGSIAVQPAYLQSMTQKGIVTRMLFNLKGIYYQKDDYQKAISIVERILILNPGIPSEIRDRGLLYMQTSLFAKALADLEYYMSRSSSPEDASYIEGHIKTLRGIVSSGN